MGNEGVAVSGVVTDACDLEEEVVKKSFREVVPSYFQRPRVDVRKQTPQSVVVHRVQEHLLDVATPVGCQVVAVVDHTNPEAVWTAFIVKELLKDHFPLLTKIPHVLAADEKIPDTILVLLVICSNGCFLQVPFLRQLVQAQEFDVGVIPIITEERFRIPREPHEHAFCDEFEEHDLVALSTRIFEVIGIRVYPQDSQDALCTRVAAIAKRLHHGNLKALSAMGKKFTVKSEDSSHLETLASLGPSEFEGSDVLSEREPIRLMF